VKVNFDDFISVLFKEVRNLKHFKSKQIKVSYSLEMNVKDYKVMYPYAMSLRDSIFAFKQICAKVDGKISKLVA
jgi:hypothetical protein